MNGSGRCSVCGCASGNVLHHVREMMFGTREKFAYFECGDCGALTLQDPPSSLSPYYPREYHSFDGDRRATSAPSIARALAVKAVLGDGIVATACTRLGGALAGRIPAWTTLLAGHGITTDTAILDVGCGSGHRLRSLLRCGFRNLAGTDPYLPADGLPEGITFFRSEAEDVVGRYGVVMFHHSLEHVADATSTLRAIRGRLKPNAVVIVRIPLADSFAWRRYRGDWVQLDAPRHFLVPTIRAIHVLADRTGFAVTAAVHDSDAFQFWGSEQYRRGIPLTDSRSHLVDPDRSPFSAASLRKFARYARKLNRIGDGDQAAFVLRAA